MTEEKAYCLLSAEITGLTYREDSEIDFTSAKTKKKIFDMSLSSPMQHRSGHTMSRELKSLS